MSTLLPKITCEYFVTKTTLRRRTIAPNVKTKNKMNFIRSPTRQMVHEMYANFIASDFRCSRHGAARPPDSDLFITTQLHFQHKLNINCFCSQVVRNCHRLQVLMDAVQMARRGGRRKAQHRGNKRSYVSSAATEPPGTITTRSHVKGVKVRHRWCDSKVW